MAALAAAALLAAGCGRRAAPAPKAKPAALAQRPLPEWAPKHPSPEFVRAARVLKPMPEEAVASPGSGDLAQKAFLKKFESTWPAIYEFFGTLSDVQIEHFRKTKRVYIPIRELTPQQRKALDNWLDAFARAEAGDKLLADYRVFLYKNGAREDFSNVSVGFDIPPGEGIPVHLRFLVRQADGKDRQLGLTFAYME